MSFEMTLEVIPATDSPMQGKGALGTRWFQIGHVRPDTELGNAYVTSWSEDIGEPWSLGAYANQCLNLRRHGKTTIR